MKEASSSFTLSHPCVVELDGVAQTVAIAETDHCCTGFRKADAWLRGAGLQREGKVGSADARLMNAHDLVAAVVPRLREDPLLFLCPRSQGCDECEAARASVGRPREPAPPGRW